MRRGDDPGVLNTADGGSRWESLANDAPWFLLAVPYLVNREMFYPPSLDWPPALWVAQSPYWGFVIVCILIAVVFRSKRAHDSKALFALDTVSGAAMAISAFMVHSTVLQPTPWLAFVGMTLCGASAAWQYARWGQCLAGIDLRRAVACICGGFVLAGILKCLFFVIPLVRVVVCAALVALAVVAMRRCLENTEGKRPMAETGGGEALRLSDLWLIPVVIVALDVLDISVISEPAQAMLSIVISFIPNIVAALILIWLGMLIGKFAGALVRKLIASSGMDKKIRDLIGEEKFPKFVLSAAVGLIVQILVDIFFIVQGLSVLNLTVFDDIGLTIIHYLPNVVAAALIFGVAFLLANGVEKLLTKNGFKSYGKIVHVLIMIVAVFMILNQLGIATILVNTAFILALGAVAVAFAIAFGIGGRDFAKKQLGDLDQAIDKIKKDSKAISEEKEKAEQSKEN